MLGDVDVLETDEVFFFAEVAENRGHGSVACLYCRARYVEREEELKRGLIT